jgi:hypothetical protein
MKQAGLLSMTSLLGLIISQLSPLDSFPQLALPDNPFIIGLAIR